MDTTTNTLNKPSYNIALTNYTKLKASVDISPSGNDCAVLPIPPLFSVPDSSNNLHVPEPQYHHVASTDFFTPIVDDPYLYGQIACANVLSDLYAQGCDTCSFIQMIVGVCTEIPQNIQHEVTRDMIRGFVDKAKEAGTIIAGGQTILNPVPFLGGTAVSFCSIESSQESSTLNNLGSPKSNNIPTVRKINACRPGDVVVLTKPLGTQLSVNLRQWKEQKRAIFAELLDSGIITENDEQFIYSLAVQSMTILNLHACKLMKECNYTGATDVTGFGPLSHADSMLKLNDVPDLAISFDTLPILRHMDKIDANFHNGTVFKLTAGKSSETSGGLLITFSSQNAQKFIEKYSQIGFCSWIVGKVVNFDSEITSSFISEDMKILPITSLNTHTEMKTKS